LAKAGWKDVLLLERDELTSGSTWHAAGLLPYFNMSYATTHIHDHSIRFYKTLEEETGLNPGFQVVGNLRMAQSQDRMDEYMLYASTAETCGVPYEWMTPAQIRDRWPLVRTEDLKGAIFHPTDGYINPADVTQAMAKGARARGAAIERRWQVDSYAWDGERWKVQATKMEEKGGNLLPSGEQVTVHAEHVVTATGNHAQRTARLLGIKIPAIPVEHQYIVTEPDPALMEYRKTRPEHPVLRDADAKWYVREERGGWILGPYERNAPARFEFGCPDGFRADLFPLDLERIEEEYMSMIHRIPSSETVGLKDDFNGPICYTPDGNPLLGPAPGLRNLWLAEGFSFGITAAGGTGHYLAQLMVEGEAEIDMASLDPKRYGPWMTTEYAVRKNEECYSHVYILHHPDEEREACRPLRTAPAYDRQRAAGAQFGQVNGWERPNYYGPENASDSFDHDARSFRRGAWWQHAVDEAKAIRKGVGLIDATAFSKHVVHGPGAAAFLDWFTCNRLPGTGRVGLTYALTAHGTTRSEYTIMREAEDRFLLVSAGAWHAYDRDFLLKAVEDREAELGRINVEDWTARLGVFAIAGPRSREVLKTLIRDPDPDAALSNALFPWLSLRQVEFGMCPTLAARVAYTGELGWELHHPIEMQNHLWDRLMEAGAPHDMKLVGARAQNWLRQEKSYRAFGTELGRDATPLEAGLNRFVDLKKDFLGKAKMMETGIRFK
ncbi:MAG: FAD-dependent oxidoreductase, partial [Boseongicola sp.]|nr:FAD-dependent oxidoreductase [Boseongicola sp.]